MLETGRRSEYAGTLAASRRLRLILRRRRRRQREGNLAAALTQSMALAVIGTAGAYPSWVLVSGGDLQIVLGASWVINKAGPASGSLLLGPNGAPLMLAIAFCCIFSVLIGSLALTLDFLGWRRWRSWAPFFHGFTTLLIVSATALGFCLLEVIARRIRTKKEFHGYHFSISPGQSLFLAFLACILAAAATYISFRTPALTEPSHSPRDLEKLEEIRFFPSRAEPGESTDISTASFPLRRIFGLGSDSMDDRASEREELYECENCRNLRTSSFHECSLEKRRRLQEAKEVPDRKWPRRLFQGESKAVESENEEKVCSSET
ncbi:uncharacterized protein LOC113410998 [Notechis scutatus]|uniref:Uncharacterized protein LOC113410998 n=1 Tax=Notechis scutatus TaxID=8663 RepID=A0A6J1TT35_9SAUR|nr:uncharacterized protein LOC113410998 [Notechis scutatus]